jgi:hypothetical protein
MLFNFGTSLVRSILFDIEQLAPGPWVQGAVKRRQEAGDRGQESGVRRQETGGRRQKTEGRRQKTGVRSQESEVRRQETGDREFFSLRPDLPSATKRKQKI